MKDPKTPSGCNDFTYCGNCKRNSKGCFRPEKREEWLKLELARM